MFISVNSSVPGDDKVFFFHSAVRMQHSVVLMLVVLWVAQTVQTCPDVCKCSQKAELEKLEVDCHRKALQHFPAGVPHGASVLNLGG